MLLRRRMTYKLSMMPLRKKKSSRLLETKVSWPSKKLTQNNKNLKLSPRNLLQRLTKSTATAVAPPKNSQSPPKLRPMSLT